MDFIIMKKKINLKENKSGEDMKNIVLIGMPASGKSTIGKLLAKKIKFEYYDVDRYLERKEKRKISSIFEEKGEGYFRNLETKYLRKISKNRKIIISTGGGAIKKEINVEILKKNGIIIFINRKVEDIYKENHVNRPLLKDINNIYKLYEERIELYKKYSDVTVENNGTLDEIVKKIEIILYEMKII